MSEHTPGPWDVTDDGNVVESEACLESGLVPAMTATIEGTVPMDDGVIADAHLIAAAPDLLAVAHVARNLVLLVDDHAPDWAIREELSAPIEEIMEQIDFAIAKAEGGQH